MTRRRSNLLAFGLLALPATGCSVLFSTDDYRAGVGDADAGTRDAAPPDGSADATTDGPVMGDGSQSDCVPDATLPCNPDRVNDCGPQTRCDRTLSRCVPCDCDGDQLVHPSCLPDTGGEPDCDDANMDVGGPTPIVCGDGVDNACIVPPGVDPEAHRSFLEELELAEIGQLGASVLGSMLGPDVDVSVTILDPGEGSSARGIVAAADGSALPRVWAINLDPDLPTFDLSDFTTGLQTVRAADVRRVDPARALLLLAGTGSDGAEALGTTTLVGEALPSTEGMLVTSTLGEVAVVGGGSFGSETVSSRVVVRQPVFGAPGATATAAGYTPDLMSRTESVDASPPDNSQLPVALDGSAGLLSLVEKARNDVENTLLVWDGVTTTPTEIIFPTPVGQPRIAALDRQRYLAIQPSGMGVLNLASISCTVNRMGGGCTAIDVAMVEPQGEATIQAADLAPFGPLFAAVSREARDENDQVHTLLRWLNADGTRRLPAPRRIGTELGRTQPVREIAVASTSRVRDVNGQALTETLLLVALAAPSMNGGDVHMAALKGCSQL